MIRSQRLFATVDAEHADLAAGYNDNGRYRAPCGYPDSLLDILA